ncbi:MAG TPA: hypothetical protein ENK84_01100 [Desulfobulbus sp.]|nr:hypothetical protein [Desulfobulbus sp.]
MLPLYVIISTFLTILFLPVGVAWALVKKKYRGRTLQRLGLTLHTCLPECQKQKSRGPVIWIHALSVGEVTSALPLVRGLRKEYPDAILYFSTTTRTGLDTAGRLSGPLVDAVFFAPFDFFFSVRRFINLLHPSLFILVETDFWPGWLLQLNRKKIPCMLVNGRFSRQSITRYLRFGFLFRPMFDCFQLLSLQTVQDMEHLQKLGIAETKIKSPGNLKFDARPGKSQQTAQSIHRADLGISGSGPILVCGSTHNGEEELLFAAWKMIKNHIPDLLLIIAPRDINRVIAIEQQARNAGLSTARRSGNTMVKADLYLLDTLGELAACYHSAAIAFIGGSLVPAGGHNPVEAAIAGIPVLFGPHMEDFAEISRDLIAAGGAAMVAGSNELADRVIHLLLDQKKSLVMGKAAENFVITNQGVVNNHLREVKRLLASPSQQGNG